MRRILFGLLALVLLGGCGEVGYVNDPCAGDCRVVDLTPAALVGTWQNGPRDSTIVFRDDGTFSAVNVPAELYDGFTTVLPSGFDKTRDRIDTNGTWEIKANRPSPGSEHSSAALPADGKGLVGGGMTDKMRAFYRGSVIVLGYILPERMQDRGRYTKCAAECPTA